MKFLKFALFAGTALNCTTAFASDVPVEEGDQDRAIVVTGERTESESATKTDAPLTETPQPVTVISDDTFEAQGAVSISDTLNHVSGVQSNPYGPDSRVDGGFVRGINALQFRDGMRDIFSYYASIRSDPYNFSQVEVVRGPASVLFGAGSLGGIVNLVSKKPSRTPEGEIAIRYGSFDRKEAFADVTGPISSTLSGRIVGRVRDSGTQTEYVDDDRIMIAPSLTWEPGVNTEVTFLGLYQEDDGGSTSQFLPLNGTILPNPNGQLDSDLFIGKPGWDRYDGRLAQGSLLAKHRFSDFIKVIAKARYIDSDLTYFTHYPNSYTSPTNPYLDAEQRIIGNYADGNIARMEIFSSDNNVQVDFDTGSAVEHVVLAGVDYSWNRVRKESGLALETIDIFDIDYGSLSDFGGGIPMAGDPGFIFAGGEDTKGEQVGFYVQDQIRFFDRASLVLGARHDKVRATSGDVETYDSSATSFRAGLIAELAKGVSPFVSYTESFEPIAGTASDGNPFVPKSGRQIEGGVKFHPSGDVLVTATAYHIRESNRPIDDVSTPDPFDQVQIGSLTSRGFELEAKAQLVAGMQLIGNYSYVQAEVEGTGQQLDNVPKHNASLWATRPFALSPDVSLMLGGGIRYVGESTSFGPAFPDGIVTPSYTLVDAVAELSWNDWSLGLNATNLLGKEYYSACLARGDCFQGAERNLFATVTRKF